MDTSDIKNQTTNIVILLIDCGNDVDQVTRKHRQILDSVSYDKRLELEKELAQLMQRIKMNAGLICDQLVNERELIEKEIENEEWQIENEALLKASPFHQKNTLTQSFVQLIQSYRNEKVKFRDECKLRLKQHLNVELTFTEEEVEGMLEDGDFSAFVQNYTSTLNYNQRTLEEIQARHEYIKNLNCAIDEIHQLIEQTQTYVRIKGLHLENASDDTQLATELTSDTDTKVGSAERWRKLASRKRSYLLLFGIFFAVILLIVIFASFPETYPELPRPMPMS